MKKLSALFTAFVLLLCTVPCAFVSAEDTSSSLFSGDVVIPDITQLYFADSGAFLIAPSGWIEKEQYDDDSALNVKYVPKSENGTAVMFGCYDLWSEMTSEEQQGLSRAYCNQSALSIDDIRTFVSNVGITVETVGSCSIEERGYYYAKGRIFTTLLSQDIQMDTYCLIRIEQGWLYYFQLTGLADTLNHADLHAFAEGMNYPIPSSADLTTTAPPTVSPYFVPANTYTILLIAGIAVAVIVILVLGIRLATRPAKRIGTAAVSKPPAICYCRYCGKELPESSLFCPFCGKALGE